MFQSAQFDPESWMSITYIILTGVCGVAESASVLLCVRNIVVLHLVHPDNMSNYVAVASEYLIAPIRFNFVAILALVVALAIYSFWQYQWLTGFIFVFGVIFPAVFSFLHDTAAGIRALHQVQPWNDADITRMKDPVKKALSAKSPFASSSVVVPAGKLDEVTDV